LRYAFGFDPATMTAGHNAAHEMPAELTRRMVE
jgi:hypothetical protein